MVVLHTCRNSTRKRPYQAGSRFSRFVEQGTPQYCRNPQCRTAIRNTTASNKCNDANQWLLEEAVSRISRVKNYNPEARDTKKTSFWRSWRRQSNCTSMRRTRRWTNETDGPRRRHGTAGAGAGMCVVVTSLRIQAFEHAPVLHVTDKSGI